MISHDTDTSVQLTVSRLYTLNSETCRVHTVQCIDTHRDWTLSSLESSTRCCVIIIAITTTLYLLFAISVRLYCYSYIYTHEGVDVLGLRPTLFAMFTIT